MIDRKYRLQEEHDALSEKIEKLCAFIASGMYRSLDKRERKLLNRQLRHMLSYRYALTEYLALYNNRMGDSE